MFYLKNFKNFKEAEIDLSKPFTILIGPNGSGKSNLIEGIELLSYIAQGYHFNEIKEVGRGGKLEIRGGLQSCPTYNQKKFSLSVERKLMKKQFIYQVEVSNMKVGNIKDVPRITMEKFKVGKENIFYAGIKSENISEELINVEHNSSEKKEKISTKVSNSLSVLSQYKKFAWIKNKKYQEYIKLIQDITYYFESLFVLDPDPKSMRKYEQISNNVISKNGENLSAVLYSLHMGNEEQKKTLNHLLNLIKHIPEEPYEKFDFIKTRLDDVVFGLKHAGTGQLINAYILSDGTLRTLAVLTALETVAEGSLIIIEEFDNGLHPSRLDILVKAIDECSRRRKLNVLVTTHNPATLNALEPEQLDGVVLCTWNSQDKTSELIRLYDLPRYYELLERGRLGDLVTHRVIEKYLIPDFEEKRKEAIRKWLKELS